MAPSCNVSLKARAACSRACVQSKIVPILPTLRFSPSHGDCTGTAERSLAARATASVAELDITKMAPLADRILVKAAEEDNVSSGGVLLTSSQASNEDAQFGEVLEVGDKVELKVAKGDTVVYSKYGTTDIDAADGRVVFVRSDSILGVCA